MRMKTMSQPYVSLPLIQLTNNAKRLFNELDRKVCKSVFNGFDVALTLSNWMEDLDGSLFYLCRVLNQGIARQKIKFSKLRFWDLEYKYSQCICFCYTSAK